MRAPTTSGLESLPVSSEVTERAVLLDLEIERRVAKVKDHERALLAVIILMY